MITHVKMIHTLYINWCICTYTYIHRRTLETDASEMATTATLVSDLSLSVLQQDPQRKEVLKPLKTLGLGLEGFGP